MNAVMNAIPIFLIAPDNRLAHAIWSESHDARFDVIRVGDFDRAKKLAAECPGSVLLAQWNVDDILERLAQSDTRDLDAPLFVYSPVLQKLTVKEGDDIRFALLQFGAAAVFSQLRQLPGVLEMVRGRHGLLMG